jgi:zinc/manganese transport system substrate-binding protein
MLRVAAIAIASLALAGCAAPAVDDGRVHVVASTNVYGSIAEAIGGDYVTVTSLIDSAAQDPHSFEASAQDRLAVAKSDLVIANGGGYDPFIDQLVDAASTDAVMLSAAEIADLAEGANEHLWYDFDAMQLVAVEVAAQLSVKDLTHKDAFSANLSAFLDELAALSAAVEDARAGESVAITEPVPLYLLELAGFTTVTPDAFSEAIEEGTDVAPAVLRDTLDAVTGANLLAYNSQTASPETEQVREAAEHAGVQVIEFTETLPAGETYLSWMQHNVEALT